MSLARLGESDRRLLLPTAAYVAATLLHLDRLPLWCSAAAGLALLWRASVAWHWPRAWHPALPGRGLRVLLVLVLLGLTLLAFQTINGIAAGSALLAGMGAAKLLETRTRRDGYFMAGVALFLLTAACLDRQALGRLPFYLLVLWLCCAALAALGGTAEGLRPQQALRSSGSALLWALPLAVLAFLLFPRIPGPLWGMGATTSASSGLGDEMTPGSITELSLSDAIVFRAQFDGPVPAPPQRYWRGPVLHDFDGATWRRLPGQVAVAQAVQRRTGPVTQHITLEPTGLRWWYALDSVASSPSPRVQLTFDQQLLANRPVNEVTQYEVLSWLQVRHESPLSATARRLDLRLPQGRNPRSLALARQLRAAAGSDAQFVQQALDWLRAGGFRYTLSPPLLGQDSVDELLFATREGFCGHYASAFTVLMRAGGVPARVVTGYQGGEWNPVGGYLLLRQADAHAWSEVWLDGQGWTRVDPTAVVEPARLQRGLRDLMPDSASTALLLARSSWLAPLLQRWDAAGQWWQGNVVGYDWRAQQSLLDRLGLPQDDLAIKLLGLAGGGAVWLLAVGLLRRWRRARLARQPPVVQDWARLRGLLADCGIEDSRQRGPLDLAECASLHLPDLAPALRAAAQDYAALRFGPTAAAPNAQAVQALRRQLRDLHRALQRRRTLLALPAWPDSQLQALRQQLPLARRMPWPLARRASALATALLQRVAFRGCNGLQVTEPMRQLVAFQAAILVLHRGPAAYRPLHAVLLYPDEFVVAQRDEDESGVVHEGEQVLSGQTVDTDCIVLSWADVQQACQHDDGYNVVLHEFAHLLDHVAGGQLSRRDGEPDGGWHDVMEAEYQRLCRQVDDDEPTLIDPYGSEDPAEFFAVCTETFFGLPQPLRQQHPDLYALLQRLYGLSPADWDEGMRTR